MIECTCDAVIEPRYRDHPNGLHEPVCPLFDPQGVDPQLWRDAATADAAQERAMREAYGAFCEGFGPVFN